MSAYKLKGSIAIACLALVASSAFARTAAPSPAPQWNPYHSVYVQNFGGGCARAYVDGRQFNIGAGQSTNITARSGSWYSVTVFRGANCGGAGVKTLGFNGGASWWPIY